MIDIVANLLWFIGREKRALFQLVKLENEKEPPFSIMLFQK
jgi:hypothetical protein